MTTAIPTQKRIGKSIQAWSDRMGDMRMDYEASKENRFLERPEGMETYGSGADYSFRDETRYYYLLGIARALEENSPVVRQGVSRAVQNIVQGGYVYEPDTGVDLVDRRLKERWERYTADDNQIAVDREQEKNWHDFEKLSASRVMTDGDCCFEPLNTGQLKPLEAHRLRTPHMLQRSGLLKRKSTVHMGVELDFHRKRKNYWVTKMEYDGYTRWRYRRRDMRSISAWQFDPMTGSQEKNFFQVYHPFRLSQTRGVSSLAPVANTLGMHADLHFAKLVQAQMVSYVAFIHKVDPTIAGYEAPELEAEIPDPATGTLRPYGPDLSPGAEYWPRNAGEEINGFSPNVPNPEFFNHARMCLTFVAVNLNLPLMLFLLDATETNFSSWRGSLEQAKLGFKEFQRWHSSAFHSPVVRFQQRRWIRQDRELASALASLGEDFWRHSWGYPRWPYVEPLKDVQADMQEIASGMISPRRVAQRKNLKHETIVTESCADVELLIDCAMDTSERLNTKYAGVIERNPGERVRWREVAYPRMASQMNVVDPEQNQTGSETEDSETEDAAERETETSNR